MELNDLLLNFLLPSSFPDAAERLHFFYDIRPRLDKGEEVIIYKDGGLWIRADEIIDLKGCPKCKNEFLPYYDIAAMREFDNPNFQWRTDFRFTKDVQVEVRDGKPYIDNGALSEKGDLLYSTQGTLGETFWTPERCYVTESLKLIELKYKIFTPEFIALWLESKKEQVIKANQSSMIPSLNRTAFNKMLIPIFPMFYQDIVVKTCDAMKAHINAIEKQIEDTIDMRSKTADAIFEMMKESETNGSD